ncbi:hypothetical protein INT08_02270 [Prosthecochloris sp. N3]|uniref:Tetratricopeptide repeat protein n=1 Tax=Prosthecochloris ethylica TaxID=2743976 RepID=A0ABR9XQ93_9CHLB|nr:tetratricopeptide repeat protein [Prosthecochloris ethylica]MBF0587140.1 hypothetical protein [Prosthecochloris ethylica]MBF0636008.1 hypothetical protein [Prosthecochloris ethylica]MEC9485984.1 tetratricopeptide repeat protein [Prosthecochloris sp.]NUK48362.1 hypothetical protein [Prosthecochloris ethylica]
MLKDALGNYRGTLSEVDRLLSRNRGNAMAWYDRANIRHGAGDVSGAADDYTEALRIGLRKREELLALGNRAMALSELGRLEEAIRDCTCIIDANPRNRGVLKAALLRRADLNNRIGRTGAAYLDTRAAENVTTR